MAASDGLRFRNRSKHCSLSTTPICNNCLLNALLRSNAEKDSHWPMRCIKATIISARGTLMLQLGSAMLDVSVKEYGSTKEFVILIWTHVFSSCPSRPFAQNTLIRRCVWCLYVRKPVHTWEESGAEYLSIWVTWECVVVLACLFACLLACLRISRS